MSNFSTPPKYNTNRKIEHFQENLDANKKRLVFLPDDNESDNNSVDSSDSIKGRKVKKKNYEINKPQGGAVRKR